MLNLNCFRPFLMHLRLFGATQFQSKTKFLRLLMLLVVVGFSANTEAQVPAVTKEMRERSVISQGNPARINAVLAKARRGESICVASIGGSITAGAQNAKDAKHNYVQQLAIWFEDNFPGLKVNFVNAGIGATDSDYGAIRMKSDVLDKKPDLVVIEYAVNNKDWEPSHKKSYEGALRQLLSSSTSLAVIELFFMHKDGKSTQPVQVELGRHYGLPMISFKDAMWPEFQSGRLKWEDFYGDVVHPSNEGQDVASELLRSFMDSTLAKLPASNKHLPKVSKLPSPLFTDAYQRCVYSRGEDIKPITSIGWSNSQLKFWECTPEGGAFEYEIQGEFIHLGLFVPGVAKNNVKISIDGAEPVPVASTVNYPPVTKSINGLHNVKIIVKPYQASATPEKDIVKLWWVGAAGIGSAKK